MKPLARRLLPARAYDWLWSLGQVLRRMLSYPEEARVETPNYDAYWRRKRGEGMGTLSRWQLHRAEALASCLRPGDRVLDLGTGNGAVLGYLIERSGIEACGLDGSPEAVAFCREQGLAVRLADLNGPIGHLLDGPYDCVVLSEILEHLADPERLLEELRGHVGRSLLVSIPNSGYVEHRLRLLLGKFPLQWLVSPGEHLRFWTHSDFQWWARQMGFEIAREIPYQGFPWLRTLWPNLWAAGIVYELKDRAASE